MIRHFLKTQGAAGRKRKRSRALVVVPAKRARPYQTAAAAPMGRLSSFYKGPFKETVTSRHKYCDFWSLNPTAGVVAFDSWSLNNMYDPYDAAGGHQPLGFDQMAALYTKWQVIEAQITFLIYTAPGNQLPLVMHLCPGGGEITSNTTAFNEIVEKPNVSFFPSSSTRNSFTKRINIKKFFGKAAYDAGEQQGTNASGPTGTAELICQVGYGPMDAASDLATAGGLVVIEYKAVWSQPRTVTTS